MKCSRRKKVPAKLEGRLKGLGDELIQLHLRVIDFQTATFPGQTLRGVQTHLLHEVREWRENPGDRVEAADVLILFLASLWRAQMTPWDAVRLAGEKMAVNEKREWPAEADAEGVFHHVEATPNLTTDGHGSTQMKDGRKSK